MLLNFSKYAEYIEEQLKAINLRVDVLFPNADVPLSKVLGNIASRGCLYAILVTNQHEEHNSITVNILYGVPAEHRNMPVEDAVNLLAEDFRNKCLRDAAQANNKPMMQMNAYPKPVPIIPAANVPIVNNSSHLNRPNRHPDAIQILVNLLAENLPLTVLQYDRVIKYLQDKREQQIQIELGETVSVPDPEIELQKKILSILNKPSVAETHHELLYPSLQEVKQDYRMLELLKDTRVQRALDSLMNSNMVATVENYMKF